MDKSTYRALQESIRHWEVNERAAKVTDASISADDCALCRKFAHGSACEGCPVAEATGFDHCANSPFYKAFNRHLGWEFGHNDGDPFRVAAQEETNFLRALVPAGGPSDD